MACKPPVVVVLLTSPRPRSPASIATDRDFGLLEAVWESAVVPAGALGCGGGADVAQPMRLAVTRLRMRVGTRRARSAAISMDHPPPGSGGPGSRCCHLYTAHGARCHQPVAALRPLPIRDVRGRRGFGRRARRARERKGYL